MAASKTSKFLVYGLLGLLIIGLAGFGASGLSGTVRTVGEVGDRSISVDRYARELQQVLRSAEAQREGPITFSEAQAAGLDRAALSRVVTASALEAEADRMGISIGDETLRDQILAIPAFRRADGSFDREAYAFALDNNGLTEAEFEAQLRRESARTLLQASVVSGIEMPNAYRDTLLQFLGERRSFTFARLDQDSLDSPLPDPDEDTLRSFHEANEDLFTLPETKRITYAWLLPDALAGEVTVDETALRQIYQERLSEFVQPERRLVERLVFSDASAAEETRDAIAADERGFEEAVAARGLEMVDVDLGDVTREQIGAAGDAVFSAEEGAVVGPFQTDLGPALYRVNGTIEATETSFEDALPFLREDAAMERARRQIETRAAEIDDMLAAGATLEDLAAETEMELGTIDWFPGISDGIAAYDSFADAARDLTLENFPEIGQLEDGGVFAMRLDEIVPPRLAPFETVRDEVLRAWELQETESRLRARAEEAKPALEEGQAFETLGFDPERDTEGQTRRGFVPGTPPAFLETLFEMEPGDVGIVSGTGSVWIVRLDGIAEPDAEDTDVARLSDVLSQQAAQDIADDIFGAYGTALQRRLGVQINQQALNAVHSNFQ